MAAQFQITLADRADEAALRRRMAEDHMQGDMVLSFRREPNYFLGCSVQGDQSQIIKCTDSKSGRIVGLGARHTTRLFINGLEVRVLEPGFYGFFNQFIAPLLLIWANYWSFTITT